MWHCAIKYVLTLSFRKPRSSPPKKWAIQPGDLLEDTAFKPRVWNCQILNQVVESQLFTSFTSVPARICLCVRLRPARMACDAIRMKVVRFARYNLRRGLTKHKSAARMKAYWKLFALELCVWGDELKQYASVAEKLQQKKKLWLHQGLNPWFQGVRPASKPLSHEDLLMSSASFLQFIELATCCECCEQWKSLHSMQKFQEWDQDGAYLKAQKTTWVLTSTGRQHQVQLASWRTGFYKLLVWPRPKIKFTFWRKLFYFYF